jgi:hypothetical protein
MGGRFAGSDQERRRRVLEMWVRLELPSIDGPVRGFTFPRGDVFFVATPSGLVRVALYPIDVRTVANAEELAALYDSQSQGLRWDGEYHLLYDANGGDITLCDHPNGERIVMDRDGTLLITDPDERVIRQRIASIRLPGKGSWMFAGFSENYRWLIAGAPGGVQVYRHEPDTAPEAAQPRKRGRRRHS